MRRYIAFIILFLFQSVGWSAESEKGFSGEVRLLSHYVEYGLSQSNNSPALQGDFWFNLGPQFKAGLGGSSVNYANTGEYLNLYLQAELKIDISANTKLYFDIEKSNYYDEGHRNDTIFGLRLNFWDYRVLYNSFSNWEGTDKDSARFGFGKTTQIFTTWNWDLEVGYNTPGVAEIGSYFDGKTGIGRKFGPIFFEGSITGTSAGSNFEHGEGDFFLILSAKTEF